jgi:hypothetical protein
LYPSTNVILGDFNFVENLRKDKIGGNLNKGDLGLKEIIILKADFSIEDVFRNKFPSKVETTCGNGYVFCRLDRFYVPTPYLKHVINIEHNALIFSDHKIATLTIKLPNNPEFGPSYWKCNIKILENNEVKEDLETLFRREKSKEVSLSWWDELKQKAKNIIISNSKRISREGRKREFFLERQLAE